ncbi:histidine kinase [Actinoplanes sp. NPDC051861]|uniref:sensor histidine kinase n=1 Tax=Actinoplanes sp. NPDC051861 TaxID=3155170 RepID=UPI0034132EC5
MSALQRPAWRSRAWPVSGAVLVVLLAVLLGIGADGPFTVMMPSLVAVTALTVAAWAVWRTRRNRQAYEARLTHWAATEATLAERLRIARDLHDIVSHGLGLITVRAAAVRHVTAGDPGARAGEELRDALLDIETASRHATAELRRMLTVLRDTEISWLPIEGLAQLPDIARGAEVAGLRVRLEVADMGEVSQGVQLAVCKTVREALHNTARHAGPTDVRVEVHRKGELVTVTVTDTGPAAGWHSTPGAGHGLAGIRERVTGLGGTLAAGPDGHGFRVEAHLPDEVTA